MTETSDHSLPDIDGETADIKPKAGAGATFLGFAIILAVILGIALFLHRLTGSWWSLLVGPVSLAALAGATAAAPRGKRVIVFFLAALAIAWGWYEIFPKYRHASDQMYSDAHDRGPAVAACESAVADQLKAPATAAFSEESATQQASDYRVSGMVDSDNSFGVKVRTSWSCTATFTEGNWVGSASVAG